MYFEKIPIQFFEKRKSPVESLEDYLKERAEVLQNLGLPVDEKARIQETAFTDIYSKDEIERDVQKIVQRQKEWEEKELAQQKFGIRKIGEKFEEFFILFINKMLEKEEMVAVRSSNYDDVFGGVDHLILDVKTGNIVAGIDTLSEISGRRYERKIQEILAKNLDGGARIKYGVRVERGEIKKGRLQQVPVFLFALPSSKIDQMIEVFDPQKVTPVDEDGFRYFLACLKSQTDALAKKDLKTFPQLEERFREFREKITSLSKEYQVLEEESETRI